MEQMGNTDVFALLKLEKVAANREVTEDVFQMLDKNVSGFFLFNSSGPS